MDRDLLDTPQFHLFCHWFIVCLCVFMCLCVWERERISTVWRDLVILPSQKKTKTKFSPHVFSNNEQAELGKHLAVLPSLPDLHLSPSFPASPFRSLPSASVIIHQVSSLVRELLSCHTVWGQVQGEVDDGKLRPAELYWSKEDQTKLTAELFYDNPEC